MGTIIYDNDKITALRALLSDEDMYLLRVAVELRRDSLKKASVESKIVDYYDARLDITRYDSFVTIFSTKE